jgi:hypothetical protein
MVDQGVPGNFALQVRFRVGPPVAALQFAERIFVGRVVKVVEQIVRLTLPGTKSNKYTGLVEREIKRRTRPGLSCRSCGWVSGL